MNWLAKMVKIMHEYYELIGLAPFLISTSLCIQNLTVLDLFTGDFFFSVLNENQENNGWHSGNCR
jgi:hypothetical protein